MGGCTVAVVNCVVAAIGLGSNLESAFGDRAATLREAIRRAGDLGAVVGVSRFHETAPVEVIDQPDFLNAAMLLETRLGPAELMQELLEIERGMGRIRVFAKGPRVIDLDLLLYGDRMIAVDGLTVPHPAFGSRRFVLEPLAEIAPDLADPVTGRTVVELLAALER